MAANRSTRLRRLGMTVPITLLLLACVSCGDSSTGLDTTPPAGGTVIPVTPVPDAPLYKAAPVGATASGYVPGSEPSSVFDYDDPESGWQSGGTGLQWLQIDLGSPRVVREIRLAVRQSTNDLREHRILIGQEALNLQAVARFSGTTVNGQLLTIAIPADDRSIARYVRIETTASASTAAWGKIEILALATNMPRFFGYYGDAFSWLTPASQEIAGHANISWVGTGIEDLPEMPVRIQAARALGLRVALAIPQELFFATDLTLHPGYARDWQQLAARVAPYIDSVSMILPIDEPYSQAKILGIQPAMMKERLSLVGASIKEIFPSVPLGLTYSSIDFDTQQSAFSDLATPTPSQFDWVGFDCYGSWDSCGEPAFRAVHPIPWYFDRIRERLTTGQKIFLFADGFVPQSPQDDGAGLQMKADRLLNRADQYLQLALSRTEVIGLFVFLYQDDYVEENRRFLGVRHWLPLQRRYAAIGREITSR